MRKWNRKSRRSRHNHASRGSRSPWRRTRTGLRKRTGRLIIGGMVLCLLGLASTVGYQKAAPVLAAWTAIRHITISGLQHVDRKAVLSLLDLPSDASLLSINSSRLSDRLETHPWVANASVGRILPHTLAIAVTERRAAAVLHSREGHILLDAQGHVLSTEAESRSLDLPVLVGLHSAGLFLGDQDARHRAWEGIQLAGLLRERFGGVPKVDMRHPQNVVAQVNDRRFQFGSSFVEQWKRYRSLEPSMPADMEAERHDIDLRYSGKVILRKRG